MKSIFISSTFKDMNSERDLVLSRVIPDLQIEAKKHGENINAIDLRWGVETLDLESDEGSRKILDVCFDEIDKSSPYMLVFLGERYGWIPEESIVKNALENHAKEFETDDFRKSVTALEIEYGILSERIGNPEKCVVCFRNLENEADSVYCSESKKLITFIENEEAKQKLQKLKEKIRQRFGNRIIEYTGKWDFTEGCTYNLDTLAGEYLNEAITKAFLDIFKQEWEQRPIKNWIEQEERYAQAFYEKKILPFRGREALIERYYKIINEDSGALLLHGEDGSGKSSFLCKVAEKLKAEGNTVFTFFSGISEKSCQISDFLKRAIYFLEDSLGESHRECLEDAQLKAWFQELCRQSKQPLFFFIDALEQLLPEVNEESIFAFRELFPEHVKVMLSCGGDSYYRKSVLSRNEKIENKNGKYIYTENIPYLTMKERFLVIDGITRSFGKTLNDNVIMAIDRKIFKAVNNENEKNVQTPLYLDLLLKRLNMMDYAEYKEAQSDDALVNKCIEIVEGMPVKTEHAVRIVIYEGINRLTKRFSRLYGLWETMDKVCGLISFTRCGINQEAIEYINTKGMLVGVHFGKSSWAMTTYDRNVLEWLWHYMDDFLTVRKGGMIDFVNQTFRNAIRYKNPHWAYVIALLEYIDTLDANDLFRVREGLHQVAFLIKHDIIRVAQNYSNNKKGETSPQEFLERFHINEEWVYKRAAGFFADFAQFKNRELKKAMSELYPDFYIKYLDEYFVFDIHVWKVKRELLVYLLTDYRYYDDKLNNRIHCILLEEEKAGREDTELLLLSFESLKRRRKSYAIECFNYSEKLYLREKTWENANKMWKYCLEVTEDYKYQYRKVLHEENPQKRAIYQSNSYKEIARKQYEDIIRVARDMYWICLEYHKSEEAIKLLELLDEICKQHEEKVYLLDEFEVAWDIYEQGLHTWKKVDLGAAEKLDWFVCDLISKYIEYPDELGKSCRMKVLSFLGVAKDIVAEYIKAGYEFEYLDLEMLEQIIEALSISWDELIASC